MGTDSQLAHAFAIMVPCPAADVTTPLLLPSVTTTATGHTTTPASYGGSGGGHLNMAAGGSVCGEDGISEQHRPLLLLSARLDVASLGSLGADTQDPDSVAAADGGGCGRSQSTRGRRISMGVAGGVRSAAAAANAVVPGQHGHVKLLSWQEGGGWQLERVLEAFAVGVCARVCVFVSVSVCVCVCVCVCVEGWKGGRVQACNRPDAH